MQTHPDRPPFRQVLVVLNPVSGTDSHPTEDVVRQAIAEQGAGGITWDIVLTQGDGDARRAALEAHDKGYDLVIAAGGDGTVREVAEGLLERPLPMSILPAGTANVLSVELGFPQDVRQIVAALTAGSCESRRIDAARMDGQTLLLRAGIGYEAEISVGASRAEKNRFGRLAYFATAWRKLRGLRPVRYHLTIDGQQVISRGVTCMICNSANVGIPGVKLIDAADISDGRLDVIVIADLQLPRLVRTAWRVLFRLPPSDNGVIRHWQGREVAVRTRARQTMAIDGEFHKRGKQAHAVVLPSAIQVVVPRQSPT